MKKYFQITFVLGVFGILVFLRELKGNDMPVVSIQNANNQNPTPASNTAGATSSSSFSQSTSTAGSYKNGNYVGSVQDAFYGNIQVQVSISNGRITAVTFLQYPNDNRTSQYVNSQADPILAQEAIQAQSSQVNIVSGASASSQAFQASLADALSQAK
ncbi:MAG: FMN-binding protein [Candidatus Levyibacteriota bacterium]|jgi:uncharacterized protein with FMN-binding domain